MKKNKQDKGSTKKQSGFRLFRFLERLSLMYGERMEDGEDDNNGRSKLDEAIKASSLRSF